MEIRSHAAILQPMWRCYLCNITQLYGVTTLPERCEEDKSARTATVWREAKVVWWQRLCLCNNTSPAQTTCHHLTAASYNTPTLLAGPHTAGRSPHCWPVYQPYFQVNLGYTLFNTIPPCTSQTRESSSQGRGVEGKYIPWRVQRFWDHQQTHDRKENKKLVRRGDSQTCRYAAICQISLFDHPVPVSPCQRGWSPWTIFVIFGGWVAGWPGYDMVQKYPRKVKPPE